MNVSIDEMMARRAKNEWECCCPELPIQIWLAARITTKLVFNFPLSKTSPIKRNTEMGSIITPIIFFFA